MENFNVSFEAHKQWVDSAGEFGKQISFDCTDMHSIPMKAPIMEQGFFSECDFKGMTFENVDFYLSEFYSCDFSGAHFINCDFRKTTLDYSIFSGADFTNCRFSRVDAYKTQFDKCVFRNCSFVGFNLMEGSIREDYIEATDFDGAYLDKVNAFGANVINPLNIEKINHISLYFESSETVTEGIPAIERLQHHD